MLTLSALFAAIAVVIVGVLILWSNPTRWVNRLVFSCSFHIGAWLLCLHLAVNTQGAIFWLRSACAVSAWLPFHYWLVKESIVGRTPGQSWLRHNWSWLSISLLLAFICYTEYFIPSHSTPSNRVRGWGYYSYILLVIGLYGYVFVDGFRSIKSLTGGKRLELQVWLGGGCATALTILVLMGINSMTHDLRFISTQPIVVFLYYGATAFVITTSRIFNARQLVLVGIEKLILVTTVALTAYLCDTALNFLLPQTFAFFITTALSLWLAVTLNAWLDGVFQFYPQATTARQAAFLAAQQETRIEKLEAAFVGILKGWGQTDHALIISGSKDTLSGGGVEILSNSPILPALKQLRWATPERLARERITSERNAVAAFLDSNALGVVVLAEGPALTSLVGVGVAASRRPFTYPQITQLTELASIIESALERAHFSAKVQHTEQLATVGLLGASLAHEIRNPLVTIKTFVQLLPKHHQDAAFRDKFFRLISDEVGRIDQLTEQLLDLASPRTYEAKVIELHPVLSASLDLVAAKAAHKNVRFLTDFKALPDHAFTDASAAKQVMLNLCFNAIQAAESQKTDDRWVKIATRNTGSGIEMAVADSGLGIAPEIRPRLFQPFQTTKSTGFGLGLAICSDILANLNASITVDPPEKGCGATFRVTFPCQPLSS
jgi:signal transduction histidine kinase